MGKQSAQFSRAIVRKPGENFALGLTSQRGPAPDIQKALEQHESYCAALERCGLELLRLEPDLAHPDSTFVEDVAVLAGGLAVLTRPGAKSREGEVAGIRGALAQFFQTIHEITAPGTVDGGDICETGEHFFVGVSHRTNEAGALQLAGIFARAGYGSTLVDIRGMKSILHLKSGVACVGEGQLVVMDEMAGRAEFRDYEIIRVTENESYAANCVRVNDSILIPSGFPKISAELKKRGLQLVESEMSEFRKMDGGLSCLSLRF